jgi:hypothetical protein
MYTCILQAYVISIQDNPDREPTVTAMGLIQWVRGSLLGEAIVGS